MLPNFRHGETSQREETASHAVEFFNFLAQFLVLFFLEAGIEVCLENRFLGIVPQCLDKARVVEPVEHVLADVLEFCQVRVQQDDSNSVAVGEVAKNIDKAQVREHGENANLPCLVDDFVRPGPSENIKLVGVNFEEQERLSRTVGTLEFLV